MRWILVAAFLAFSIWLLADSGERQDAREQAATEQLLKAEEASQPQQQNVKAAPSQDVQPDQPYACQPAHYDPDTCSAQRKGNADVGNWMLRDK